MLHTGVFSYLQPNLILEENLEYGQKRSFSGEAVKRKALKCLNLFFKKFDFFKWKVKEACGLFFVAYPTHSIRQATIVCLFAVSLASFTSTVLLPSTRVSLPSN